MCKGKKESGSNSWKRDPEQQVNNTIAKVISIV